MKYGPMPIGSLKGCMLREMPRGGISLSSSGLFYTGGHNNSSVHFPLTGEGAFREVQNDRNRVAVLAVPRLEIIIGAVATPPSFEDWPAGWIAISSDNRLVLAVIAFGMAREIEHLLIDISTGNPEPFADPRNLTWISEWSLQVVDDEKNVRYPLVEFRATQE